MTDGWTGDVDDSDEPDEEQGTESFTEKLAEAVEEGSPSDIPELELLENVDEVEDEDLLREAWLQLDGEKENIVKNRIEDLGGSVDSSDDDGEVSEDDAGWGGGEDDADESDDPGMTIESGEELDEVDSTKESEPTPDSDSSTGAGLDMDDLLQRQRRWKIMVWGPPKTFKTHFGLTMPEPIAFLDLEGKVEDTLRTFPRDLDIKVWKPMEMEADPDTKFRRTKKALMQALEWLEMRQERDGDTGTLVVDSMSQVWEWAQIHHKIENYPLKDPDEVELSANFTSSQESDWAVVKEYHNGEFRDLIVESDFHYYWTAKEREEFNESFDDEQNRRFMEPKGEPDNDYAIGTEIRARKDKDRGKVGDLQGSNYVDNHFAGLEKPTFPKVKKAVEEIEQAEASDGDTSRAQVADEIGAEAVIDYDPQVYTQQ